MDEFPPDLPPEAPQSPPPPFAPPAHEGAAALPPLPFEDRTVPWFNGLVETILLITKSPDQAFARMSVTGDMLRPIVYALIVGTVGYMLGAVWQAAFAPMMQQWVPSGSEYSSAMQSRAYWLGFAACSPLIVVLSLVLNTLIFHLFLMIVGGAKRGLTATMRPLCYSLTAMLAGVVPICGSLVATIWYLYLLITGLAAAHGISKGKVAVAILLPALLCCACVVMSLFFAYSSLMSSGLLPGVKH